MAVDTYANLQTAISDRLARADFTAAQLQESITFAEAEMQRVLRTLDMETKNATFAISSEYVPVPVDFLQVRSFYLNTSPRQPIRFMPNEEQTARFTGSGIPKWFSVSGGSFRFAPCPAGSYTATLTYFAALDRLSTTNTANWLLRQHPDAYLYGALKHAAIRLQDDGKAQGYTMLFQGALEAVQRANDKGRWSGPMSVRADVVV